MLGKSTIGLVAGVVLWVGVLPASALKVSLGIRETAAGGGPAGAIGDDAGTLGGIEHVNKDGQTIPLDNQWHPYSWDIDGDPLTAFAGSTANSVLQGTFGSFEELRLLNDTGLTDPITIWIDYVVNTVNGGPVVVQGFEGFADGTEVMFQEPGHSGSTSANVAGGDSAGVDNTTAFHGAGSYRAQWQFVDSDTTRWVRFYTFGADNGPNPLIRFDQGSVVSVYIKAVPEPATAVLLGGGALLLVRRRRGGGCRRSGA